VSKNRSWTSSFKRISRYIKGVNNSIKNIDMKIISQHGTEEKIKQKIQTV
jgi:hypothetical protein